MSYWNPATWYSTTSSYLWRKESSSPASPTLEKKPSDICFHIEGFVGCDFFDAAVDSAEYARHTSKDHNISVDVQAYDKASWPRRLAQLQQTFPPGKYHKTSPVVYEGCDARRLRWVGGCGEFHRLAREDGLLPS